MKPRRIRHIPLVFLSIAWMLAITSCAGLGGARNYRKVLTFSAAELQVKLENSFPMRERLTVKRKVLLSCAFENPHIQLQPDSERIGLRLDNACKVLDIDLDRFHLPDLRLVLRGHLAASGELDYASDEGRFYLDRLQVHELSLPGLPFADDPSVKQVITLAVNAYFDHKPIYDLREHGITEEIGRWILRTVDVRNGEVVVTLGLPE